MICAELENEFGKWFTVDLSQDIYKIHHILQDNGVRSTLNMLWLRDDRVQVTADDDVGKKLLGFFTDRDNLGDVQYLAELVGQLKDNIRPAFEEKLLGGNYRSDDELLKDIQEMKIALATEKLSFYCPLAGSGYMFSDYGDYDGEIDFSGNDLLHYQDSIEELLEREQPLNFDMGECVARQAGIPGRIPFIEWAVEENRGELYGRIDCYLSEKLDEAEVERLRETILGQNSDGLGESLEQRPIKTEEGELYVSFWHRGDDYFLLTEDEFARHMQPGMGGMRR